MSAARGLSSDIRIAAVEPHANIHLMQACYAAYREGGDGFLRNWWDFSTQVRKGHIIPAVIEWQGQWAQIGVELLFDKDGPYLGILYYNGSVNMRVAEHVMYWLFVMLQKYKAQRGLGPDEEAYVQVVGRPGWRRMIKRLGLYQDEDGFISDQQGVFSHGLFGRQ